MKKFFSLIALVGVFAACQPEDLKTVFKSAPAQLTINVTKVVNSVNGKDVTSVANKTNFALTGNPDIPAGTGTVSASYNSATGTAEVGYPHILADTAPVNLNATVFIPGSVGDYTISVETETGEAEVLEEYILKEAKDHGYNHAGDLWVENASDLSLFDSCKYKEVSGEEMDGDPTIIEDAFEEIVKANYDAVAATAGYTEEEKVFEFQVPSWCLYKVVNTISNVPTTYKVVATPSNGAPIVGDNGVVGTFKTNAHMNVVGAEFMDHPSHAGHSGSGSGHGSGSNAGGGLVPAE